MTSSTLLPRTLLYRVPSADSSRFATKYTNHFVIEDPDHANSQPALDHGRRWSIDWQALKMCIPRTRWMITFVAITMVQAVVVIGLQSFILYEYVALARSIETLPPSGVDPSANPDWYSNQARGVVVGQASVIIFELVYQIFLVLDAGRRKNIIQITGACLNNLSMLLLVAIAFVDTKTGLNSILLLKKATGPTAWAAVHRVTAVYTAVIAVLALSTSCLIVAAGLGFREFEW